MIANHDGILEKRAHPENFDENTGIFCEECYPAPGKVIVVDNAKNPHCANCGRKVTREEIEYGSLPL